MGVVDDDLVTDELRVAQGMLPRADVTMTEETSARAMLLQGRVEPV